MKIETSSPNDGIEKVKEQVEGNKAAEKVTEYKMKNLMLTRKIKVDELKTGESSQVQKKADMDDIVLPGKTKSGRLIKPKRFFEDTREEEERRPRKRSRKLLGEASEENSAGSRKKCSQTSTQCAQCELELASHSDLFRHLLVSHVPPEVVKTLPVYAEGETGWCQNCEEPLPLSLAEQHMAEKHPELLSLSVVSQNDLLTTPSIFPSTAPFSEAATGPAHQAKSPSHSDLTSEEAEDQETKQGDLTEQSERLLEQVEKVLEDEEEEEEELEELKFCADMGREMAGLDIPPASESSQEVSARFVLKYRSEAESEYLSFNRGSRYKLKDLTVRVERIKLNKVEAQAF